MVQFLMISTLVFSSAAVASKPAQWQDDYGKALAATKADDRPLLVVLDVPSDPKTAADSIKQQAEGGQTELLAAYQLCHIDASTEYGKRVAKVFKADKFPFTAIIDKTGSIVLHKQQGKLSEEEWNKTLSTYKKGDRSLAKRYTSAYRGSFNPSNGTSVVSPSYCPSCQRNAQQQF